MMKNMEFSLWFLPDSSSDTTVPCALYLQAVVRTADLGTCNCSEMAPSDFPTTFKSIMCSFRSLCSFFRHS